MKRYWSLLLILAGCLLIWGGVRYDAKYARYPDFILRTSSLALVLSSQAHQMALRIGWSGGGLTVVGLAAFFMCARRPSDSVSRETKVVS